MKKLILFTLINLNLACGNQTSTIPKTVLNDKKLKSINDSLLKGGDVNPLIIEKKNINTVVDDIDFEDSIDSAISNMFTSKICKQVDLMLTQIDIDTKISTDIKIYWRSYIFYYKSIYYKSILNENDNASINIELAIKSLEENSKTSEDFALLAACKSFSIQFANMTQIGKISGQVEEYASKSLELNSKNIRAYYVLASNNFYTPKMFGGMVKVEEYSLKGLACPISSNKNFYSPYWGKKELYDIYIKYLETENRKEDSEKFKKIAKKEFLNKL